MKNNCVVGKVVVPSPVGAERSSEKWTSKPCITDPELSRKQRRLDELKTKIETIKAHQQLDREIEQAEAELERLQFGKSRH